MCLLTEKLKDIDAGECRDIEEVNGKIPGLAPNTSWDFFVQNIFLFCLIINFSFFGGIFRFLFMCLLSEKLKDIDAGEC